MFNVETKHRPGKVNVNADALSRVSCGNCEREVRQADDLAEIQLENVGGVTRTRPSLSAGELQERQITGPVIRRLHYYRQHNRRPTLQERRGETRDVATLLNQWGIIEEENGILYRVVQDPQCGQRKQLILPQRLKEKVLTSLHDGMGHQGTEGTLHLIRDRCYLPGIHRDVEAWIKKCERCTLPKEPLPLVRPVMGHLLATQ